MSYKDNYKSIQVNLLKNKHADLIEWIEGRCKKEERSLNSLIIQILKEERERCSEGEKEMKITLNAVQAEEILENAIARAKENNREDLKSFLQSRLDILKIKSEWVPGTRTVEFSHDELEKMKEAMK